MNEQVDYIAPQNLDADSVEMKKIIEEIDREIMRSVFLSQIKLQATELPKMTTDNYARQYAMYGVPVISDPTKLYILNIDIPEEKKPWYKRLWKSIKAFFKSIFAMN